MIFVFIVATALLFFFRNASVDYMPAVYSAEGKSIKPNQKLVATKQKANKQLISKKFEPTLKDFTNLPFKKQFCYLKNKYPHLNLYPYARYQQISNTDDNDNQYNIFYFDESRCPKDKYSIMKTDENGNLLSYMDCESTSLTDLFLNTEFQYTISNSDDLTDGSLELASVGRGYFLVMCIDDHNFYITRKGKFKLVGGLLINEDNCALAASHQAVLTLDTLEHPDSKGCFKNSNSCLAVVDPQKYKSESFEFFDKEYAKIEGIDYSAGLKQPRNIQIIPGAKEDRYNHYAGILGLPNWDFADIVYPPLNCE